MYQYLAWFHRGNSYPSGNKLYSLEQVNKLKSNLLGSSVEVHESVQRYNSLGAVAYTPIYADFDGENSLTDVLGFVNTVKSDLDVMPDIYFSGNRGFHTFINIPVTHAYPHLVVKKFMSIMLPKATDESPFVFDEQMYTSRHLLRCEGSIHFKTNLYKTRVRVIDLLSGGDYVRTMASKARVSEITKHESHTLELFLKGLYLLVDKEVAESNELYKLAQLENAGEISPCIKSLISDGPVTGQNNEIITLIARNMNAAGIGMTEGANELLSVPKWLCKSSEIKATFKSIYKGTSRFGCKGNETLRQYCDPFCPFNQEHINIM